jgi:hypothetical protein
MRLTPIGLTRGVRTRLIGQDVQKARQTKAPAFAGAFAFAPTIQSSLGWRTNQISRKPPPPGLRPFRPEDCKQDPQGPLLLRQASHASGDKPCGVGDKMRIAIRFQFPDSGEADIIPRCGVGQSEYPR